jgi:uncharacterized Zn finger protein
VSRLEARRHWWSRRWLEVLEGTGAALARGVQRGQGLARRGAVERLDVRPGRVTARVLDDAPRPYEVELAWPVPDDDAWDRAVAALSDELRFTAALLDGELPEEAEEVLGEAGVPLVPGLDDVGFSCGCGATRGPCRHAAATWTAAASVLDRDVFALLRLRGRNRDEVLAAVRSSRGVGPAPTDGAGLDLERGLFAPGGDLEGIALHPTPVADPAALFRQLGEPPGVDDEELFERLIERAAATAWRLAAGDGTEAADEEVLLAELRAQRVGTADSLAEALGRDVEPVREELDRLFSAGTVMRTGSGEGAKYRAAVT